MALEKFKRLIGQSEESTEEVKEEEYYKVSREEFEEENGIAGSKMILKEPKSYSESQQIADHLKERNSVVVNLKRVTPDQAKRIVDFLYGTLYAIGGDLQRLGGGIFLCTPNNVSVEGEITDENSPSRPVKKAKKEEEDDEFDW